ncbi:MAG: hypothetical protein EZS28_012263 [Streblomastix strix]|uniref:Uncharacterized protein n=1 Tax=Streblomastix strix TaxID=222440 RepID=A0A5J4WC29_9EUKA|nr:MAG: hypothetical protein EZS28_012263 [Streblomastix strix]
MTLCKKSKRGNHKQSCILLPMDLVEDIDAGIMEDLIDPSLNIKKYPVYMCFRNKCFKKREGGFKLNTISGICQQVVPKYIKEIDIGDNKLQTFNSLMLSKNQSGQQPGFDKLRRLWLDGNQLTTVVLEGLPKLEELYLNHNKLRYIPSLAHLNTLMILDLSSNDLFGSISALSALSHHLIQLDLSYNQYKWNQAQFMESVSIISTFKKLEILILSPNPFNNFYTKGWIQHFMFGLKDGKLSEVDDEKQKEKDYWKKNQPIQLQLTELGKNPDSYIEQQQEIQQDKKMSKIPALQIDTNQQDEQQQQDPNTFGQVLSVTIVSPRGVQSEQVSKLSVPQSPIAQQSTQLQQQQDIVKPSALLPQSQQSEQVQVFTSAPLVQQALSPKSPKPFSPEMNEQTFEEQHQHEFVDEYNKLNKNKELTSKISLLRRNNQGSVFEIEDQQIGIECAKQLVNIDNMVDGVQYIHQQTY